VSGFLVGLDLTRAEVTRLQEHSKKVNVSPADLVSGLVRMWLQGKMTRPKNMTAAEADEAQELAQRGMTLAEIGEALGRTKSSVARALNKKKKS
jgi:lambda repressor-like predicted transcriptional regulator